MPPFPNQNLWQNFLKTGFFQQQKRVDKSIICFIKIQSENMKLTWNMVIYILCDF